MLSAKILTVLALLTVSASGLSVGHPSGQLAHRRHTSRAVRNSVVGARAARRLESAQAGAVAKRDVLPAVKSSSALPSSTPVPDASSASAEATTANQDPGNYFDIQGTSTSVKPTPTKEGSSSGDAHTGEATFYATGLGACGITNNDSQFIAAVSHLLFDGFNGYTGGNPNKNPICNKKVTAHYQGKSVSVIITDRCVGCEEFDLDFSPAAFDQLADQSLGRLKGMTWSFDI
ncbi:hypothetical protein FRC06_006588 [Ceratobasidium sp. 370]|nr:hypothetical protein FRC06_006588 [Ceratobasidium sp. 370]